MSPPNFVVTMRPAPNAVNKHQTDHNTILPIPCMTHLDKSLESLKHCNKHEHSFHIIKHYAEPQEFNT